jgi:hypothetical protein
LSHPLEIYLAITQIPHRRTDAGSPQTNGFCERFHRTVKEGFFAVAFRRTLYESLAQLQADLDAYLMFYNRERAHQGYRTQGWTPYQDAMPSDRVSCVWCATVFSGDFDSDSPSLGIVREPA